MEQKVKQDATCHIGQNIRTARRSAEVGQTELVRRVQLAGVPLTREALVKIERGAQHLTAAQLRAIRDALHTSYEALLLPTQTNDA